MENKEIKIFNPKLRIFSNIWNVISFIIFVLGAKLGGIIIGLVIVGIVYGFGYITIRLIAKLFSIDLYIIPTQKQIEKIKVDKIKNTKTSSKSIFILIAICVIPFLVLLLIIYLLKDNTTILQTAVPTITISNKLGCTRTTRLDNKPQYDRALSLIYQRISESKGTKYKYFPPELSNCIKIIEEKGDNSSELEGYFVFNNKDIKTNYYPIIVNSQYQEADDVVVALLLTHEMTHVQQYINTKNGKTPLSCMESEIESFYAQRDFWPLLNKEELQSILSRYNYDESLHPQIKILFTMLNSFQESKCDFFDFNCSDSYLKTKLEKIIENDSYYKKQCKL